MDRNGGQPQGFVSARPWIQAGNPLQQLAAAKAQAASQPNLGVGHGATLWPAATIGTSRPVGPLARFHFSQPQTSSQNYSQQQVFGSQNGAPPLGEPRVEAAAAPTQTLWHLKFMKGGLGSQVVSGADPGVLPWSQTDPLLDHHGADSMADHRLPHAAPFPDASAPSQENSLRPANTAAKLLSDIRKQAFSFEPAEKFSIKLEAMEAKQDAVAGQVEGISKELAGQGAKLERLEASCGQLVQALRAVTSGTAELEKQVQHALSQRRPVMSEMGVQTSPMAPAATLPSAGPRPSAIQSVRLTARCKQANSAEAVPSYGPERDASAGKRRSRPGGQRGVKGRVEPAAKSKTSKPDLLLPSRRLTRQSALEQQPARVEAAARSEAEVPVLSISRRRRQEPQQQGQGAAQQQSQPAAKRARAQPAVSDPSNAALLFDLLFGEEEMQQQQQQPQEEGEPSHAGHPAAVQQAATQEQGKQGASDEEEDVMRMVQAKMQRHRAKLMKRRSARAEH